MTEATTSEAYREAESSYAASKRGKTAKKSKRAKKAAVKPIRNNFVIASTLKDFGMQNGAMGTVKNMGPEAANKVAGEITVAGQQIVERAQEYAKHRVKGASGKIVINSTDIGLAYKEWKTSHCELPDYPLPTSNKPADAKKSYDKSMASELKRFARPFCNNAGLKRAMTTAKFNVGAGALTALKVCLLTYGKYILMESTKYNLATGLKTLKADYVTISMS